MASLATRFKNLVSLAVKPIAEDATKELAASQSFQMEVESAAMVRLLLLSQQNNIEAARNNGRYCMSES